MRIAIISEVLSKQMGYLENCLPKYLSRLGADVHLITMDLLPYYQMPDFDETYGDFLKSERLTTGTIEPYDGYALHVLPHHKVFGYMRMVNLTQKLRAIRPDIVQTTAAIGWIPLDVSLAKPILKYKLFTGSHTAASMFPISQGNTPFINRKKLTTFISRYLPGRLTSLFTEKCYAVTSDCRDIAVKYFGVQSSKVEIMHLGVDTDYFRPADIPDLIQERQNTRKELGLPKDAILCIYTGKFTEEKNPLILAKAIRYLKEKGEPFFGIFIGDGFQRDAIQSHDSCIVLPFMPFHKLPMYYRASDIAIWPTNESTSMLDAAACGLPLIVSDGIVYRDHVEGNGLVYRMNDIKDLIGKLQYLRDPGLREELGKIGAKKMKSSFSWDGIAKKRYNDYVSAL
jgi:glycosyltransferase involved in cell wall biosynthesis